MINKTDDRYSLWKAIGQRCFNPKCPAYPNYGGRGITRCERWNDFEVFAEDMGPRPSGATIERIDNDGDYCPENCRWATRKEQSNNRRSCIVLTFNGETKNATQWAEECGVSDSALLWRLRQGWPLEKVLTPARHRPITYKGETKPLKEFSRLFNIAPRTLAQRLDYGWDVESALTTPPNTSGYRKKKKGGSVEPPLNPH